MVHVYKEYNDVPPILESDAVEKALQKILRAGILMGFPRLEWLMHTEVLEALLLAHHDKCAYCEQKISLKDSSAFVRHYRPTRQYYWLVYEWSNLLPVCKACSLYIQDDFPLENEHLYRIKTPPMERKDWLSTSMTMRKEEPLLLNPELDDPSKFIRFTPEGYAESIKKNYRGTSSIEAYHLNQGSVVVRRRKKIEHFFHEFESAITHYKRFDIESMPSDKAMSEYFIDVFDELVDEAQDQAEFSLLGKGMLYRFDEFFIQKLQKPKDRKILLNAYEKFMTSNFPTWTKPVRVRKKVVKKSQEIILKGISIQNVKCFGAIGMRFPNPKKNGNISVIVGTNGNGKSTILQLLALGLRGLHRPPVTYGWSDVIKTGAEAGSFSILLNVFGDDLSFDFEIDKNDLIHCTTHPEHYEFLHSQMLVLGYGTGRKRGEQNHKTQFRAFESIASLFGENDLLKTMNDERTASYVNEKFPEIKLLINQIMVGADNKGGMQLDSYSGKVFYFNTPTGKAPIYSMSDGFQTIFAWLFDMLIRMLEAHQDITHPEDIKGVVLMDELDMHLNLTWQRNILPCLEDIFPQIQFIIATQSPFTIQSMTKNNVSILELEGNKVAIHPFFNKGLPWGWTISEIMMRMINEVTESSILMDSKLSQLNDAARLGDDVAVQRIGKEIRAAIPPESPYHLYLDKVLTGSLS